MANKQVKFYSMTSAAYNTATKDTGGIYFLDNNEIYKGTKRFGANKVWESKPENNAGVIAGDIFIGGGKAEVFSGTEWKPIVDNATGLDTKASVGTSYADAAGVNVSVTLTSNAEPSLAVVVSTIDTAVGITDAATSVVAGKAVYALTNGLVSTTTDGTYIKGITRDPTTKVLTADVGTFSDDVKTAIGHASTDGTANGVTVSVSTADGNVKVVTVDAANLKPDSLAFASTSTVAVNQIVTSIGPATGDGAATDQQLVTALAVAKKFASLGDVMEFKGVVNATSGYLSGYKVGDVILIGPQANIGWYNIGTSEAPATGALTPGEKKGTGFTPATPGQEYICIDVDQDGQFKWELIGDQDAQSTILGNKAQVGTGNAAGAHGVSATVVLNSDAAPTLSVYVDAISASTGIVSNAANVVTAGAVADFVNTKITGGASTVTNTATNIALTVGTDATASVTTLSITGLGTAASKAWSDATIAAGGTDLPTQGAVASAITAALENLDADVSSSNQTGLVVSVTQVDGVITGVQAELAWLDSESKPYSA